MALQPYFASKVLAEAPLSAAVSALGGVALYPLVGFDRSAGKFGRFVLTLVLEGFASGGLGLALGAVAPSTDVALALFPPLLVLMIIFNGFNLAAESTPKALRWLPAASFIRWASEGLAVNEFTGLTFERGTGRAPPCETGEQALERVSFQGSTVKRAALMQWSASAHARPFLEPALPTPLPAHSPACPLPCPPTTLPAHFQPVHSPCPSTHRAHPLTLPPSSRPCTRSRIIGACYGATLYTLQRNKPKFMSVLPPA